VVESSRGRRGMSIENGTKRYEASRIFTASLLDSIEVTGEDWYWSIVEVARKGDRQASTPSQ
jgi:hypothetical protein